MGDHLAFAAQGEALDPKARAASEKIVAEVNAGLSEFTKSHMDVFGTGFYNVLSIFKQESIKKLKEHIKTICFEVCFHRLLGLFHALRPGQRR